MSRVHRLASFLLLLLAGLSSFGSPGVAPLYAQGNPAAVSGVTRALVVFVRFADDQSGLEGCRAGRGWPLAEGVEPIPQYAAHLFATHPTPPFADSSATEYFFRQSNGTFTLVGDVYPRVVSASHEAAYYRTAAGRGYGYLALEIFQTIDPDVDFARYDTNPKDGIVDQIFIVIRHDDAATFTGVADLAGADRVRGRPAGKLVFDGVEIEWASSGSFIVNDRPGHIISQSYMVRMIAHEFGHHIWNPRRTFFGHVPAIRSNDIPANDTNTLGYILMAGRGGGKDGRGDLLISAPERDALGWIAPRILSPKLDTLQTVVLGDLYETGDAVRIDVDVHTTGRGRRVSFYVTNRQRRGWFDRYRLDAPPGCEPYEMGLLRTTGLLVMLTEWHDASFSLDVLPADNTLELAASNPPYQGDLFGPGSATQITPFTSPSTALPDGGPTWIAIDDIERTGSPDSSMRFTYVPDFRRRAIVREDSRIDDTFGRVVIPDMLVVENRSVLTLTPGADVVVGSGMSIAEGSKVRALAGSVLTVAGVTRHYFVDTEITSGMEAR